MYYAAINDYSNESSHGFGNTWTVLVFEDKASRDEYVRADSALATKPIRRDEVTKIAANWNMMRNAYNAPKPFSGEFWAITERLDEREIDGCIGVIECVDQNDYFRVIRRFYS